MLSDEERELLQWETDGGRHLDEPPRWRNGDMPPGKPAPPEQPPPLTPQLAGQSTHQNHNPAP